MIGENLGLTSLNTSELTKLLRHVYRDEVEFPLSPQRIACIGFQYKSIELLNVFRGLDKRAVQTILICVLAERQSH